MPKIGDKIIIINMDGEPDYSGKVGFIKSIDDIGQLHGTWGGLAVQPERDNIEIITEHICCICGKRFTGFGNNPEPVKSDGVCCDDCNYSVVLAARLSLLK